MLLALLFSVALAQHRDPMDRDLDTEVEQRLDDLEELVEDREVELEELRTAAARLLDLVELEEPVGPLLLAPESEEELDDLDDFGEVTDTAED